MKCIQQQLAAWWTVCGLSGLLLLPVVGCGAGSSLPRKPVRGSVSIQGRPVASGRLQFRPTAGGPAAVAAIHDGSYTFTSENGPVPGAYDVAVYLDESKPPTSRQGKTPAPVDATAAGVGSTTVQVTVPEAEPYEINIEI